MSIMYSFLLDSESGYNLESTTDSDFYQGTPSYLYYLLKHFYPDTTRTTIDKVQGKVIYEIVTCQCFKWNPQKILDTIHTVQPKLIDMMQKQKAVLHIDLTWEANPLINQYDVWHNQIEEYQLPAKSIIVSTSNLKEKQTYQQWCKSKGMQSKIKIVAFPLYLNNSKSFQIQFADDLTFDNHLSYKSKNTIKSFLSYNGKPLSHRKAFAAMLNYFDLLDDALVSFVSFDNFTNSNLVWDIPMTQHPAYTSQNVNNLIEKLPLILDKPTFTDSDKIPEQWHIKQDSKFYFDTWFHVVVESNVFDGHFEYNFLTEKTFRPIKAFQPFVIFSMPGVLQDLKQLGFRTFDQFWNEDYDNIKDTQQRLEAVIDVIKTLSNMPSDTWLQMYKDMQPILEHNHHILMHTEWIPTLEAVLG